MKLRDIDFGNVFLASGVLNFFGEGWWYHRIYKLIPGFSLNNTAFITKTATLLIREGNMPLRVNFQPKELMPACIKIYPIKGIVLNSVGLSGPGIQSLLDIGDWQKIQKPFFISFMAVGWTQEERQDEIKQFVDLLGENLPNFSTRVGLEINISCPNTEHNCSDLIQEAVSQLQIVNKLSVPLVIKLNILSTPESVKEICNSGLCDAIECSNTIPWGKLPDKVDWKGIFGMTTSPLAHLGGGGLSGWPLTTIVTDWIKRIREVGITIPIIAGGGIGCRAFISDYYKRDILAYKNAGANGIAIGTVIIVRPWMVERIIRYGNKIFEKGNI